MSLSQLDMANLKEVKKYFAAIEVPGEIGSWGDFLVNQTLE